MIDNDHDVRELFARLKEEDRAHSPLFRMPMRTERHRRSWSPGLAAAAVIALIALVLARPDTPPYKAPLVDLGTSSWQSPTDFLLITPGSELMRTVPAMGSPHFWIPDSPDRSLAPESTRS